MTEHRIHCETAVVVLGHQMNSDGIPDDIGLARLATAATELREYPAAILVTSGWAYRDDTDLSLADAMANAAIQRYGIADEEIVRLHDARDTVGDAVFFARSVESGSTRVVTSEHHKARAEQIFRFVLGENARLSVLGTGERIVPGVERAEASSLAAFEDTFTGVNAGDLDAIYRRMKSEHPYYNGAQDARLARRHD